MQRSIVATTMMVALLGVGVAAQAQRRPEAVSPGEPSDFADIEVRCPTFSWGATEGAESYRLVVFEVENAADIDMTARRAFGDLAPVLEKRLSGTVSSWTPTR